MRVAFDVSQCGATKAGCGYFAYSLAASLLAKPLDMTLLRTFGTSWWDPANASIDIPPGPSPSTYVAEFEQHGEAVRFWSQDAAHLQAALGDPDIVHANNFFSPPRMPRARQVYTLYDMTVFDCPEYTTAENQRVCLAGTMMALGRADMLIAISHYTKANFLEYFDFDPERIVVAPLGSRFDGLGEHGAASDTGTKPAAPFVDLGVPFFLSVGTVEPRKNYDTLLLAFAQVAKTTDCHFVIAGRLGWNMDAFPSLIEAMGLGGRVHILNYVPDDVLVWLYRNCASFVYPSHWEGFGLPVLEALKFGCTVICSSSTSLPEVANGRARLVTPEDIGGLAAQMRDVLAQAEPQSAMDVSSDGYSWDRAADVVFEAYQRVLRLPPTQDRDAPAPRPSLLKRARHWLEATF